MTEEKGFFAQLTPPGEGGIAVFRVEGRGARAALAAAVSSGRIGSLAPGELAYGKLLAEDGSVLDEVIVAALPDGEGFELNCHAGGAAAAAAAERLSGLGLARRVLPSEAGLSPLERDFRDALAGVRTRRQLTALCAARGVLSAALEGAREALGDVAHWQVAAEALGRALRESERLDRLLATHRAVIAGPVNAGKSALFNHLAGADRAITSPHPGTTRDAVEAAAALRGLSVELVDTAGLGTPGEGELARRSEEVARRRAAGAELVLAVIDGSRPPEGNDRGEFERLLDSAPGPVLVVVNKSDLPAAPQALRMASELSGGGDICVSARAGAGMEGLLGAMEKALLPDPPAGRAAAFGGAARRGLARAYTCAERAIVENDGTAAAEAAGVLRAVLGGAA